MNVETETEDMDLDEKKEIIEVMEVTEIEVMDSGNLFFNNRNVNIFQTPPFRNPTLGTTSLI